MLVTHDKIERTGSPNRVWLRSLGSIPGLSRWPFRLLVPDVQGADDEELVAAARDLI